MWAALRPRNRAHSGTASIPVFPVMMVQLSGTPSARSAAAARAVGAKCSSASRPVNTRFISSGNGWQTGLHMPNRYPMIERRQRRG